MKKNDIAKPYENNANHLKLPILYIPLCSCKYNHESIMKSKRIIYLVVTFIIILIGLASRRYGDILPDFLADYSGDTLWAAMVYFGLRFLFPSASILKVAAGALLFSYGIEISQLYQADWINAIRNTTIGALILGHGFLWSDMICYTVGVFLSAVADRFFTKSWK